MIFFFALPFFPIVFAHQYLETGHNLITEFEPFLAKNRGASLDGFLVLKKADTAVELWVDPSVKYQGKRCGGIKLRLPQDAKEAVGF